MTAGDPTSTAGGDPLLDALGAALDGEHAAVYAYGVVGAHLDDDDRERAAAELERHRAARDRLSAFIRAAGGTPSASRPAYALPFAVADATSATELADLVESRLAGLYVDLVAAAADGATRTEAAGLLVHTARARAVWSGTTTVFPGLDDRLTLAP